MPCVTDLLCAHRAAYVAALALISLSCTGCSADRSTRLSETEISNPFASQPEPTVPPVAVPPAVLAPQLDRRELPDYDSPQQPY